MKFPRSHFHYFLEDFRKFVLDTRLPLLCRTVCEREKARRTFQFNSRARFFSRGRNWRYRTRWLSRKRGSQKKYSPVFTRSPLDSFDLRAVSPGIRVSLFFPARRGWERERGNFRGIRKLAELNCREHTLLLGDSIRGIWLLCRVYELFSVEVRASMANFFAFFQGFVGCVERWEGGRGEKATGIKRDLSVADERLVRYCVDLCMNAVLLEIIRH